MAGLELSTATVIIGFERAYAIYVQCIDTLTTKHYLHEWYSGGPR